MRLSQLHISNIRNIVNVELQFHDLLNLFVGANGSGKTSLLEAIYFLGSGRSFRSQQLSSLVSEGSQSCTVFGIKQSGAIQTRLGVHRHKDGSREIKINGVESSKASELARELPVLVLGPQTVDLLLGPPGDRRKFLNWGTFHVEPGFTEIWVSANRCLKQRNRLLRQGSTDSEEFETWTNELISGAEKIDDQRQRYFDRFVGVFSEVCQSLTELKDVRCDYQRGWESELATTYSDQKESDYKRGYTQSGFHRADLRITVAGKTAVSVCSRGELKILAWALLLSQGKIVSAGERDRPVYLVDDLTSEMDENHRENVCRHLLQSGGQVLATGIELNPLNDSWGAASRKVFHVERGAFSVQESEIYE